MDRVLAALDELMSAVEAARVSLAAGVATTASTAAALDRLQDALDRYLDLTDPSWETRPSLTRERAEAMAQHGIASALDGSDIRRLLSESPGWCSASTPTAR